MPIQPKFVQILVVTLIIFSSIACTQVGPVNPTESVTALQYPLVTRVPIYENPTSNTTIESLDWNPEGDSIAVGAWLEAFVYRLNDTSLHEVRQAQGFSPIVAWSPSGLLLAGGDNMFWVWSSAENKTVFEVETSGSLTQYGRVFWNPNSDTVATTFYSGLNTSHIQIADLGNDILTEYDIKDSRDTEVLGWSPDGKYLATAGGEVHIVDYFTESITESCRLDVADDSPLAWSPGSDMVTFQTVNKEIVVCDVSTGMTSASLSAYSGRAFDLKWHPKDSYIAIAGESGVWIWNFETDAANIVQNERAFAVDWSPDAQALVTHVETEMRIYELTELP